MGIEDAAWQQSVGDWVTQHPVLARLFDAWGVDYCCGGRQSLSAACAGRNLDRASVESQIEGALEDAEMAQTPWPEGTASELCDYIERTHHAYLRKALPALRGLIDRVVTAHAARHPELKELERTFQALQAELEPHLLKEERILFPAIRQLEAAQQGTGCLCLGSSLEQPIHCMEHEHDQAGTLLKRMRQLTGGYEVPPDACPTYRAMLGELTALERDLHQHIHCENNILFPRALAQTLGQGAGPTR